MDLPVDDTTLCQECDGTGVVRVDLKGPLGRSIEELTAELEAIRDEHVSEQYLHLGATVGDPSEVKAGLDWSICRLHNRIKELGRKNVEQNNLLLDMVGEAERIQKELKDAHKESDRLRGLLAKR